MHDMTRNQPVNVTLVQSVVYCVEVGPHGASASEERGGLARHHTCNRVEGGCAIGILHRIHGKHRSRHAFRKETRSGNSAPTPHVTTIHCGYATNASLCLTMIRYHAGAP